MADKVKVGRADGHTHSILVDKKSGTTSKDNMHTHTYNWDHSLTSMNSGHKHKMPTKPNGEVRRMGE